MDKDLERELEEVLGRLLEAIVPSAIFLLSNVSQMARELVPILQQQDSGRGVNLESFVEVMKRHPERFKFIFTVILPSPMNPNEAAEITKTSGRVALELQYLLPDRGDKMQRREMKLVWSKEIDARKTER